MRRERTVRERLDRTLAEQLRPPVPIQRVPRLVDRDREFPGVPQYRHAEREHERGTRLSTETRHIVRPDDVHLVGQIWVLLTVVDATYDCGVAHHVRARERALRPLAIPNVHVLDINVTDRVHLPAVLVVNRDELEDPQEVYHTVIYTESI